MRYLPHALALTVMLAFPVLAHAQGNEAGCPASKVVTGAGTTATRHAQNLTGNGHHAQTAQNLTGNGRPAQTAQNLTGNGQPAQTAQNLTGNGQPARLVSGTAPCE